MASGGGLNDFTLSLPALPGQFLNGMVLGENGTAFATNGSSVLSLVCIRLTYRLAR
jgi:hypothetical protein